MLTLMAIGPALLASVALENRVSPKVRHATPVTCTHVISMDEKQQVIHEAHLADGSRYGIRARSSDGPLPASVTEELDVLLPGVRDETVVSEHYPAPVARRRVHLPWWRGARCRPRSSVRARRY